MSDLQHQKQKCSLSNKLRRALLTTTLVASSPLLYGIPAMAATAPAGQIIQNKATGSFIDTDNTEQPIQSNTVQLTVAEITGINVNQLGVTGTPYLGNTVYFDFTVTNVGNDPTQLFIPSAPSSIIGGTAGTIQIIQYDSDGTGPAAPISINVSVPSSSPTGSLVGSNTFNNGSIPAGGTIIVRVPVTVTATGNNPITVTLGNTPATPNNQNQDLILSTNDLYTVDNPGTDNGDLVSGDPINGDATTHRKEASDTLTATAIPNITGTIFEDVNYGGGAGRPFGTAGTVGRIGATVELYKSDGTYIQSVTTIAGGAYTFTNVPANADYIVRVVNSTVTSSRPQNSSPTPLVPVQTFRTDANLGTAQPIIDRVGGEKPSETDAPARSGAQTLANLNALANQEAQSVTSVKVGSTDTTAVDFGYNFDTIVNTNDSGQGSLRQFITNSNVLTNSGLNQVPNPSPVGGTTAVDPAAGEETSIFMIPVAALTSNIAVITPITALPSITDTFTTINGLTQTADIGDTNALKQGAGGVVGIDNLPLGKVNKPEIQIVGNNTISNGLTLSAANTTIRGLSIYGFGNSELTGNILVSPGIINTLIEQNYVGTTATSFTAPTITNQGHNIYLDSGSKNGLIQNNLVGYASYLGIFGHDNNSSWVVQNNEVRGNALGDPSKDGVSFEIGSSNNLVKGNLIIDQSGVGVDSFNATGTLTVENNTITGNGRGNTTGGPLNDGIGETPGIRVFGTGNKIDRNIIANNYGAGVMVRPTSQQTTITKNSIYGNGTTTATNGNPPSGQIGIDLLQNGENGKIGTSPYVTANNGPQPTNYANQGMNYPVITASTLSGSTLTVKGFVGKNAAGGTAFANVTLEFFISEGTNQNNGEVILGDGKSKSHGEGKTYMGTCTANSNSLFNCSFTNAVSLGLTDPRNITATATDSNGNTSEFSGPASSNPNLLLVKRITQLNGTNTSALGDALNVYKDDPTNPYDDNTITIPPPGNLPTTPPDTDNWPVDGLGTPQLIGGINAGYAKPASEMEYTIYFLSTGDQPAKNVTFCDRIPNDQTFVPNTYNNIAPGPGTNNLQAAPGGFPATDRGISILQNGNNYSYTSAISDDSADYYPPGSILPPICSNTASQTQDNGAIVVRLGDVPNATAPGTPTGAYGFVRFRVKVK